MIIESKDKSSFIYLFLLDFCLGLFLLYFSTLILTLSLYFNPLISLNNILSLISFLFFGFLGYKLVFAKFEAKVQNGRFYFYQNYWGDEISFEADVSAIRSFEVVIDNFAEDENVFSLIVVFYDGNFIKKEKLYSTSSKKEIFAMKNALNKLVQGLR